MALDTVAWAANKRFKILKLRFKSLFAAQVAGRANKLRSAFSHATVDYNTKASDLNGKLAAVKKARMQQSRAYVDGRDAATAKAARALGQN